jgi:hypothetical protein
MAEIPFSMLAWEGPRRRLWITGIWPVGSNIGSGGRGRQGGNRVDEKTW